MYNLRTSTSVQEKDDDYFRVQIFVESSWNGLLCSWPVFLWTADIELSLSRVERQSELFSNTQTYLCVFKHHAWCVFNCVCSNTMPGRKCAPWDVWCESEWVNRWINVFHNEPAIQRWFSMSPEKWLSGLFKISHSLSIKYLWLAVKVPVFGTPAKCLSFNRPLVWNKSMKTCFVLINIF